MRTWSEVGIELPRGTSGEVRTICQKCDKRCLSVNVRKGVWSCRYCGWKGGLRSRHNGYVACRPITQKTVAPNQKAQDSIERVWRESRRITNGDPVHRYLLQRGLILDKLSDLPRILRYHPCLAYHHEDDQWTHHPAMTAPVSNPRGDLVSIHRTYLTADGRKADVPSPKKLMPPAIRGATSGGAVRLYSADETLSVAEGIETALAVRLATGLPVWATVSAIGMAALIVPDAVRSVVIFADHDPSGTGQKKANDLARRMLLEGRLVKVLMPDGLGDDWADVVAKEMAHAG